MAVERAVPIYYYTRDGRLHSASGFRIDGEYILTADHCVGGEDYRVLIDERSVSAQAYLDTGGRKDVDLAILKVGEKQDIERIPCARIRTSHAERLDNCSILAFPVWKRNGRAQLDGYIPTGEVSALTGLTKVDSGAKSLLTFKCVTPPPASPTPDGPLSQYASQWQGASGAAIVHDGYVIGVLSNHVPLEGDSSLTFTPITAIDRLKPDQRDRFRSVLGIADEATLPTFPKVRHMSDALPNKGSDPSVEPSIDPHTQPDADTETLCQGGQLFADQGDFAHAESLWRRAASQGHTGAMNNLANLLYVRRRAREAHTWYLASAERGNIESMGNLASLLLEARQARDAERWFRQAAEAGNTDAMYNLAVMLDKARHFDEAITWYRRAADAGHPDAMHNLAIRLRSRGELAEATAWWECAGHQRSQRTSEKPRGPVSPRTSR
ncbi:bifunctional trypsin-like peptidase domain-containing/SEL1-like repeat protein [Nocardia sp. NPDC059764]|uniref:bifunctional trypsin-like peptidase domain-containing/SEL1-like repeat protein n=1 Tax=Nocardia sp. NPDC059764 TaxID=3346939 RepID=UPI00364CBFD6